MLDDDFIWSPAHEIRLLYTRRELSPVEVAYAYLDRVQQFDDVLHAFRTVDPEDVLAQARRAESALGRDTPLGPLHGLPLSVKDTIATAGLRTTFGSQIFADHVPDTDAVAVQRARAAGAVVFGKTNTPEFALLGHTINRLGPQTVNPWDTTRTPAGSSGGAGASLAAGLCPLALGTDAGGSIRFPAAFNGVFGLFPSVGRVPRAGNMEAGPFGYPLGAIGPMTRDVRDAAILFDALAGWHPDDPLMARWLERPASADLDSGVRGLRMGWLEPPPGAHQDPLALATIRAAAQRFGELGAVVEQVSLDTDDVLETVSAVMACGFGSLRALAADPAMREVLTPAVRAMAEAPSPDRDTECAAWAARRRFVERLDRALAGVDLLLTPTMAFPAPPLPTVEFENFLPYESYTSIPMVANLAMRPSASVPCGFLDGMPLGLMLMGRDGREDVVLRAARAMEVAHPWTDRKPPVGG